MANPHQFYLLHLHEKSSYRANWLPDKPLKIGDIGKMEDGLFTLYTTLEMEGITFRVRPGDTTSSLDYTSHDSIDITSEAKVSGNVAANVGATGTVKIEFKSDKGIVFQGMGCQQSIIENLGEVETKALEKYKTKTWNQDWVVITELVQFASATIIISTSNNSILELESSADSKDLSVRLADAKLGLKVVREQGSCTKFICNSGFSPLYKIMGIKKPLFRNPRFRTRSGPGDRKTSFDDLPFDPKEIV